MAECGATEGEGACSGVVSKSETADLPGATGTPGAVKAYLEYLEQWRIFTCTQCGCAIWPQEISAHFRGQKHKVAAKQARILQRHARQLHPDAIEDPEEFTTPSASIAEIPQLSTRSKGFQCQAVPGACRLILQSKASIRIHRSKAHKGVGHVTYSSAGSAEASRQSAWREVPHFQRFFTQGPHSSYFEVRQPLRPLQHQRQTGREPEGPGLDAMISREIEQTIQAGEDAKADADKVIEEGSVDEANRWLDRTKWSRYLKDFEHKALAELIEPPDLEAEPVEAAIWSAMDGLARVSQQTVARRAGLFVRFEAIRSEKYQTRYVPLMAYQDYAAIGTYIRPWKQILMFFARTRVAEERRQAPRYTLNNTQKQAWRVFVQAAKREASAMAEADGGDEQVRGNRQRRRRRQRRDADESEEEASPVREQSQETELEELTAIQRACLSFCITLLDHQHIHHDYDSAMVCALAILGAKSPGWRGADQYPPILSKIIKIARFMVVQEAFEEVQPPAEFGDEGHESDGEDYGSDGRWGGEDVAATGGSHSSPVLSRPDSAVEVEPPISRIGVIEAVRKMMDRFMVRGTAGPMQWMLDLRTYGLKIHYNTTAAGHVQWNEAQTLTYKGLDIHMDAFRGFVDALVTQTRQGLQLRLLVGFEPPGIPWQSIRDDPSNESSRWSFLKDERCQWPVDGKAWLWGQIRGNQTQRQKWFNPDTGVIRHSQMADYMEDVVEFRMQLLVLMHISGGAPARAPEILSVRHENTPTGQHRNMFIEDGLVTFVTKYHKGYAMSGDVKIIHRYVPQEVGELVVWYLWLVLPFQFGLERRFYWGRPATPRATTDCVSTDTQGAASDWLGEQSNLRLDCASNQSEPTSRRASPVGLPGLQARKSDQEGAVGGELAPIERRPGVARARGDEASKKSAGVSSHLWPADHQGRKVTSARMREALKRYSREHLGAALTIAAYREVAIAISRHFLRECDAFIADQDAVDEEGAGDGELGVGKRLQAIMDQQAGHTSHIAGQIYARLMEEMKGATASQRERFRIASRMWHLWLGFASADGQSETYEHTDGRKRKPVESPWHAIAQQRRRAREVLLRSIDIKQELRRMLKKEDAEFRGQQEEALHAIVRGDARVVAIMPTGEGKSVLFQLPAFIAPSGMTVVVVPLVELRRDMIQRCKKVGIVAREWEEGRQVDDATIVFVTPESAASASFATFINRNQRKLDRIVIDECHVILNRRSGFRREMARLGRLVRAEAQMVLVTATLPPSMEEDLYKRVYWEGLAKSVFRMRTVRTNIRYSVHIVEKQGGHQEAANAYDEAVVRIAEAKLRQHRPGKVIIYANSVGKVIRLAEALGVDAYYSDAHLKSEMFQDFRSSRTQMIVATSALGLGIDIADVRAVVHADNPRCLEEYAQESGRAGRDRRFSEAIAVIQAGEIAYNGGREGFDEVKTRELVEEFVQDRRVGADRLCRRRVLCEYFDGHQRVQCEEGEEPCDVCFPSNEITEAVQDRREGGIGVGGEGLTIEPEGRMSSQVSHLIPSQATGVQGSQGVVDIMISAEDFIRSEQMRRDRAQAQQQRHEVIREAEGDLAAFKRRVREWQRQCTLCAVTRGGRTLHDHSLWQCTAEGSAEAREQMRQVQKAYQLEDGAGCRQCMMPFSMCDKFVVEERSGKYRHNPQGRCRYNGVIVAGWVGVFHSGRAAWFQREWTKDMKGKGLRSCDAMAWEKGGKMMRFMGKKVTLNDESVSEFAMAFSKAVARVEWGVEETRMRHAAEKQAGV